MLSSVSCIILRQHIVNRRDDTLILQPHHNPLYITLSTNLHTPIPPYLSHPPNLHPQTQPSPTLLPPPHLDIYNTSTIQTSTQVRPSQHYQMLSLTTSDHLDTYVLPICLFILFTAIFWLAWGTYVIQHRGRRPEAEHGDGVESAYGAVGVEVGR